MDLSNATKLKDFDEFIRAFNTAMVDNALNFHAFLLTCPIPNFSVLFYLPKEDFDILKSDCAKHIDKSYNKYKKEFALCFNEINYIFRSE